MNETREQTQERLQKFMEKRLPGYNVSIDMGPRLTKKNHYVVSIRYVAGAKNKIGGYGDERFVVTSKSIHVI